ncbi:MAG: CRISPR-associated endonuclease Cas1 [Thermodesulfobacteriota bacterium]
MHTAYIVEQGCQLHKDGNRLVVRRGREILRELLLEELQQIVLMGNIILTPPVMDVLIQNRVDTVFLTQRGRFRGRLMTSYTKNVNLRQAQYVKLQDPQFARRIAEAVVAGKLQNMYLLLLRYNRRLKDEQIAAHAASIRVLREKLGEHQTMAAIRGIEGAATRSYFSVFGRLLNAPGMEFKGRNRRPPLDPVNAVLSFGYTMLANLLENQINLVGLDPYLGALHETEYGRPSLVCDLMEEYRPVFVDTLVITLVNRKVIGREDFVYRDVKDLSYESEEELREKRPVEMKPEVMRGFIKIFERKLETRIQDPASGNQVTYRYLTELQVRRFARVILGEEDTYVPFEWSR